MREVSENKHQQLWVQAIEAKFENKGESWGRQDFDRILAGYEVCSTFDDTCSPAAQRDASLGADSKQGVADFPASLFPEELVKAYPEAPIILSTRPEDAWYTSMMSTLWHAYTQLPPSGTASGLTERFHAHSWGGDFPARGREYFRRHNDLVRELGKTRQFLEYDVKTGWGPLCEFLGVPVPDGPMPHNDDWVKYKWKRVEEEEQT